MAKNKREKELKRRFWQLAESLPPYLHQLDLRPFNDLDDEGLAFIINRLKGVNMLDLNETAISNNGIRLLSHLEYVNELRAKDCTGIDDGCIEFLDQIPTLQFLHLGGTGVTIDGLLKLTRLCNLQELLFSAAEPANMATKMYRLQQQLPGCDFTVNSRPWLFS